MMANENFPEFLPVDPVPMPVSEIKSPKPEGQDPIQIVLLHDGLIEVMASGVGGFGN